MKTYLIALTALFAQSQAIMIKEKGSLAEDGS